MVFPLLVHEQRRLENRRKHGQRPLQQLLELEAGQEGAMVRHVLPMPTVRSSDAVEDLLLLEVVRHEHGEDDEDGDDLATRDIVFLVARETQQKLVVSIQGLQVVVVDMLHHAQTHKLLQQILHVLVLQQLRVHLLNRQWNPNPVVHCLTQSNLHS